MTRQFEGSKTLHGTLSGWRLHQTRQQHPCDDCRAAKVAYDKRRRKTPAVALRDSAFSTAQWRAYGRLAAMQPNLYAALYAEEKERVFRERGLS